jgi:hypothetical protein
MESNFIFNIYLRIYLIILKNKKTILTLKTSREISLTHKVWDLVLTLTHKVMERESILLELTVTSRSSLSILSIALIAKVHFQF